MARFRGSVRGNRGEVSRLGHKKTGLIVTANGWDYGVQVEALVDKDDNDYFVICSTGGSRGTTSKIAIGLVDKDGFTKY